MLLECIVDDNSLVTKVMFYILAHAKMGCGFVLKRHATAPVPSTVKVILGLLMARDITSMETVNTP